jgi:formylglycine-generating enzyme required for sulfatase activity
VDANQCNLPSNINTFNNSEYANHPVIHVSWNDAVAYCDYVDRRLPTEAEWEKAARGTNGSIYPWGDTNLKDNLLNFNSNVGDTSEVGSYPQGASIYGALDLSGNVWEWVNDWYDGSYYQNSPSSNPLGPSTGVYKVLRGGSWDFDASNVSSANRNYLAPKDSSYYVVGFRCSRSE